MCSAEQFFPMLTKSFKMEFWWALVIPSLQNMPLIYTRWQKNCKIVMIFISFFFIVILFRFIYIDFYLPFASFNIDLIICHLLSGYVQCIWTPAQIFNQGNSGAEWIETKRQWTTQASLNVRTCQVFICCINQQSQPCLHVYMLIW